MKRTYTILLILVCYSLLGQNNTTISKEEYKIYTLFIENLSSSSNIIIKDSTSNEYINKISTDEFEHLKDDDVIFEFQKINSTIFKIDKKMINIKKLKQKTDEHYFEFSRCLIKNDTLAIVYVGIQYSSLNGKGNIYLLKRKSAEDDWYIEEKIMRWRS